MYYKACTDGLGVGVVQYFTVPNSSLGLPNLRPLQYWKCPGSEWDTNKKKQKQKQKKIETVMHFQVLDSTVNTEL